MRLILRAGIVFLLCQFAVGAEFPQMPKGFRVGMEMELSRKPLANITRFFDFDELQKTNSHVLGSLPKDFFDNYLVDSPQALAELPETLRKKLTEGLQLQSKVLRPEEPSKVFLDANGKAMDTKTRFILTDSRSESAVTKPKGLIGLGADGPKLDLPKQKPPANPTGLADEMFQKQGGVEVTKAVAWQTLQERWKKLSWAEKSDAVRWENLSGLKKAELLIDYTQVKNLKLKADLPPEIDWLFNGLEWVMDQKTVEFRHKKDVHIGNLNEFYREVRQLASLAGVEKEILHPEDARLQKERFRAMKEAANRDPNEINKAIASLHVHMSMEGSDLEARIHALNRLNMIRRVSLGVVSDLTREGSHLFNPDPSGPAKGLVRQIAKDHFESRAHQQALEEELLFNARIATMDEKAALDEIHQEIKKLVSDYVVDQFIKLRPSYLSYLPEDLSPEQKLRVNETKEVFEYAKRLKSSEKNPEGFMKLAPRLLAFPDEDVSRAAFLALRKESHWSEEAWNQVLAVMRGSKPDLRIRAATAVSTQPEWPSAVRSAYAEVLRSSLSSDNAGNDFLELIHSLQTRVSLPDEIRDEIPRLLEHTDGKVRLAGARLLLRVWPWTDEIWEALEKAIQGGAPLRGEVQKAAWSALEMHGKENWPMRTWARILRLLLNPSVDVQLAGLSAVPPGRADIPKRIWKTVLSKASENGSRDSNVLRGVSKFLREQPSWPPEVWTAVSKWLSSETDFVSRGRAVEALTGVPAESWPPEVVSRVFDMLESPQEKIWNDGLSLLRQLEHRTDLPKESWDRIPKFLPSKSWFVRNGIRTFLEKQPNWPKEVWRQIIHQLKDGDPHLAETAAGLLKKRDSATWPPEARTAVLNLLNKGKDGKRIGLGLLDLIPEWSDAEWVAMSKVVDEPAAQEMIKKRSWSKAFWNEVPGLLRDRAVLSLLKEQPTWTDEVWNALAKLLTDTKAYGVRSDVVAAIRTQSVWPDPIQKAWRRIPKGERDLFARDFTPPLSSSGFKCAVGSLWSLIGD